MITGSLFLLGKVGLVCVAGLATATGLEWMTDAKIKPASSIIQLGSNNKGGNENDNKVEHLRKKIRQED